MNPKCYIIAEAGLNHNGSFDNALKLIDVASISNADAVKFQKRHVDGLAIKEALDKKDERFPEFGATYGEIRKFLEFNKDEYLELKKYSKSKNLDFIVTAFDNESYQLLEEIDVDAIKIASHSITNLPLLNEISKTKKKIYLSTGMCLIEDIERALAIFNKNELCLLHCVSSYPTPNEDCNLNMIDDLYDRFRVEVGYSGHELGFFPTLVAVAKGATVIERHYTLDKNMVGFDHKLSLEPQELIEMIIQIQNVLKIKGHSNKYISKTEQITKNKYNVSAVSICKINKGTTLESSMITYKNPGIGILPKDIHLIVGKKCLFDIDQDVLLHINMFQN